MRSKPFPASAHQVALADQILHWGQLKLYGHMICVQKELEQIQLCLIYYEYETKTLSKEIRTCSSEELSRFYHQLMDEYAVWMEWKLEHQQEYLRTAKELPFPFEHFRPGQRTAAGEVFRAIRDQQSLFLTAPTGIGKTMATLYPAVKGCGEEMEDKIFYLTAKTVTRSVAAEALLLMGKKGLCHKSIVLTAKEKLCPFQLECNPEGLPLLQRAF